MWLSKRYVMWLLSPQTYLAKQHFLFLGTVTLPALGPPSYQIAARGSSMVFFKSTKVKTTVSFHALSSLPLRPDLERRWANDIFLFSFLLVPSQ